MEVTKNDLSYNEAKLDYQAMLLTSRIAYAKCLDGIYKHYRDMRSLEPVFLPQLSAGWLLEEARRLAIVAETMETLEGGLIRENIIVVNKEVTNAKN